MWLLGKKKPKPAAPVVAAREPVVDPKLAARVERVIRNYLAQYHPRGVEAVQALKPIDNLWREVTSLTMLQLVAYIEEKFAITVAPIDFAPQNFASIAAITRFVATRTPVAP